MVPPVFKTGLAANTAVGGFDSLPPPPLKIKGFSAWAGGESVSNRADSARTWAEHGLFFRTSGIFDRWLESLTFGDLKSVEPGGGFAEHNGVNDRVPAANFFREMPGHLHSG